MKSRPFLLLTKRPVLAGVVAFLLLLGPGLYISYLRYTLHQSPATVFVIFACLLSLAGGLFAWYVASRYESLKKQMDEKDHLLRKVEASIPSFFFARSERRLDQRSSKYYQQ